MINVCVPVLKRYDLLRELLKSLRQSTLRPDGVFIVDNGRNEIRLTSALAGIDLPYHVMRQSQPMGLAETWNWFIENTPDERLITNDDIVFAPASIREIYTAKAPFVSCTFGFSCFLLRDECVDRVGLFDETISPGYAYFEDMDYLRRMKLAGVVDEVVRCGVQHAQSATPARYSSAEWEAHHRRFLLAQKNYTKKWARNPSWDQLKELGGAGANA